MRRYLIPAVWLALGCALPGLAAAHGINGHIWATDGAVTRTTACFAAAMTPPEVRNALQFGAAFPDSGYATDDGREYGETAHWEPFIEPFVRHMRATYPDGLTSTAAWRDAAFVMGTAAHGMEDEVFDSIFMLLAAELEGSDQDLLDTGTDFMLIAGGHASLKPDVYVPYDDVLEVMADVDVAVERSLIESNTQLIRTVVIGLVDADETLDDDYRPQLPWTAEHFLDPQTPGSHAFERDWVVGRYLLALEARMSGRPLTPDLRLIGGVPHAGAHLWSNAATSAAARVTLIFGLGVDWATVDGVDGAITVTDAATGAAAPVTVVNTRWGGDYPRLVQLVPHADWTPGARYVATVAADVGFIDGSSADQPLTYEFSAACSATAPCPQIAAAPDLAVEPAACADESVHTPTTTVSTGCGAAAPGQAWLLILLFALATAAARLRGRA